jgi:hypothetical protein
VTDLEPVAAQMATATAAAKAGEQAASKAATRANRAESSLRLAVRKAEVLETEAMILRNERGRTQASVAKAESDLKASQVHREALAEHERALSEAQLQATGVGGEGDERQAELGVLAKSREETAAAGAKLRKQRLAQSVKMMMAHTATMSRLNALEDSKLRGDVDSARLEAEVAHLRDQMQFAEQEKSLAELEMARLDEQLKLSEKEAMLHSDQVRELTVLVEQHEAMRISQAKILQAAGERASEAEQRSLAAYDSAQETKELAERSIALAHEATAAELASTRDEATHAVEAARAEAQATLAQKLSELEAAASTERGAAAASAAEQLAAVEAASDVTIKALTEQLGTQRSAHEAEIQTLLVSRNALQFELDAVRGAVDEMNATFADSTVAVPDAPLPPGAVAVDNSGDGKTDGYDVDGDGIVDIGVHEAPAPALPKMMSLAFEEASQATRAVQDEAMGSLVATYKLQLEKMRKSHEEEIHSLRESHENFRSAAGRGDHMINWHIGLSSTRSVLEFGGCSFSGGTLQLQPQMTREEVVLRERLTWLLALADARKVAVDEIVASLATLRKKIRFQCSTMPPEPPPRYGFDPETGCCQPESSAEADAEGETAALVDSLTVEEMMKSVPTAYATIASIQSVSNARRRQIARLSRYLDMAARRLDWHHDRPTRPTLGTATIEAEALDEEQAELAALAELRARGDNQTDAAATRLQAVQRGRSYRASASMAKTFSEPTKVATSHDALEDAITDAITDRDVDEFVLEPAERVALESAKLDPSDNGRALLVAGTRITGRLLMIAVYALDPSEDAGLELNAFDPLALSSHAVRVGARQLDAAGISVATDVDIQMRRAACETLVNSLRWAKRGVLDDSVEAREGQGEGAHRIVELTVDDSALRGNDAASRGARPPSSGGAQLWSDRVVENGVPYLDADSFSVSASQGALVLSGDLSSIGLGATNAADGADSQLMLPAGIPSSRARALAAKENENALVTTGVAINDRKLIVTVLIQPQPHSSLPRLVVVAFDPASLEVFEAALTGRQATAAGFGPELHTWQSDDDARRRLGEGVCSALRLMPASVTSPATKLVVDAPALANCSAVAAMNGDSEPSAALVDLAALAVQTSSATAMLTKVALHTDARVLPSGATCVLTVYALRDDTAAAGGVLVEAFDCGRAAAYECALVGSALDDFVALGLGKGLEDDGGGTIGARAPTTLTQNDMEAICEAACVRISVNGPELLRTSPPATPQIPDTVDVNDVRPLSGCRELEDDHIIFVHQSDSNVSFGDMSDVSTVLSTSTPRNLSHKSVLRLDGRKVMVTTSRISEDASADALVLLCFDPLAGTTQSITVRETEWARTGFGPLSALSDDDDRGFETLCDLLCQRLARAAPESAAAASGAVFMLNWDDTQQ